MKNALEEQLFAINPKWFDRDPKSTHSLMCYGFTCGDGWFELIRRLLLLALFREGGYPVASAAPVTWGAFHVIQVKEKFGALRFYYDGGDREFAGAVSLAEMMSAVICEDCGKPGTKRNIRNWLCTLCGRCATKRRKARP